MKTHIAVTLPVNPPSSSPALTQAQCWEGLKIKSREPQAFLPISECTITEDRGDAGITRRIKAIEGKGLLPGEVTEVITYYSPTQVGFLLRGRLAADADTVAMDLKVNFHMLEKPVDVSNIISVGANDELYLTFTFIMEIPGVVEGTPEANSKADAMVATARKAIQKTIDVIRQLVNDGKL